MTTKLNPFLAKPSNKETKQQFTPDRKMNVFLPFIDHGLSEIGGFPQGEDDQISDNETIFKMKDWLQRKDKQFFQENQLQGYSIKSKKPRSQILGNNKQKPQSPRSQYSKQEMNMEQYQRSADRKSKERSSIKETLPLFKLTQKTPPKKEGRKFTVQEFQRYKKLKQLVKSAMDENYQIIQNSFRNYRLQRIADTCASVSFMIKRQKNILEKVQKYATLSKYKKKTIQNEGNQDQNEEIEFNLKLKRLQQVTSKFISKENQYRYTQDIFKGNQQHGSMKNKNQIQKTNGFSKKKLYSIFQTQNDQNFNQLNKIQTKKSTKQQNLKTFSQESKEKSRQKQRTIFDEYKLKLSSKSGSRQFMNQSIGDKIFQQTLQKALAPLPLPEQSLKNSTKVLSGMSMLEFMEIEKHKKTKQGIEKLFQNKRRLEGLLGQLKNIEIGKIPQQNFNEVEQQRPKRLLLGQHRAKVSFMNRLISPLVQLKKLPSSQHLKLLPQKIPILLLIDKPQLTQTLPVGKSQQKIEQTKQPSNGSSKSLNKGIQIKSIQINFSKKTFNNQSSKFMNGFNSNSNKFSQKFGNGEQIQNFVRNDPIKPVHSPSKPQVRMVNSVTMRNGVQQSSKSMRNSNTFINKSRSFRQTMSQKYNRSPGRSKRIPNASAKIQNQFTQLPSLDQELRMEAIYYYVPQQGMDPQQYFRQGIDQKIQQFVRQNGGGNTKAYKRYKKMQSLYMSRQQRQKLKKQRQQNQLKQEKKKLEQMKSLYYCVSNNLQPQQIRQSMGQLDSGQQKLKENGNRLDDTKTAKFNQQFQLMDSSQEEQQWAKIFFKIGKDGRAEKFDMRKTRQTSRYESQLIEFIQKSQKMQADSQRNFMKYLQKEKIKRDNDRQLSELNTKKNDQRLIIHSRDWVDLNENNNNRDIKQKYIDRVTFSDDSIKAKGKFNKDNPYFVTFNAQQMKKNTDKTKKSLKKQSVLIKKVVSDNQDNEQSEERIMQKKDSDDKEERLPTFGNLTALITGVETSQIKKKQSQEKKQQQKQQFQQKQIKILKINQKKQQQRKPSNSPSPNIFNQLSKSQGNIFATSTNKPKEPLKDELTKKTSLQQQQKKQKNKILEKPKVNIFAKKMQPEQKQTEKKQETKNIFAAVNNNIFSQQKQQSQQKQRSKPQFGKISNIFNTESKKQQQKLSNKTVGHNIFNTENDANNNLSTKSLNQPQFISLNPQQFQESFKTSQNSKSFANFQSQQSADQKNKSNIFQKFGHQIGQKIGQQLFGENSLQSQNQHHQGTFQSFGPAAFMNNPQQSLQINQSLQQSGGQQQQQSSPFSGSNNPMNIIHQNINKQQNSIFNKNKNSDNAVGSRFEQEQEQFQEQKNIFGLVNRQQNSSNPFQVNSVNKNIFNVSSGLGSGDIFKVGSNVFNRNSCDNSMNSMSLNQQNPSIPKSYMQPRK